MLGGGFVCCSVSIGDSHCQPRLPALSVAKFSRHTSRPSSFRAATYGGGKPNPHTASAGSRAAHPPLRLYRGPAHRLSVFACRRSRSQALLLALDEVRGVPR